MLSRSCLVGLSASLTLCGCAASPVVAVQAPSCLPMVTYTKTQETALADALSALNEANPLVGAMGDYGAMRDADRACLQAQAK